MKIFIACSKHFYERIPEIGDKLEELGHDVMMPNSYGEPFREERMKELSLEDHIKFKQEMMRLHETKIKSVDLLLVLNFKKNNQPNYIGGATFMEIVKAWELEKKVYFYNPIPDNIFRDELIGINPTIIYGDLKKIK